jgi:hypothetical protein
VLSDLNSGPGGWTVVARGGACSVATLIKTADKPKPGPLLFGLAFTHTRPQSYLTFIFKPSPAMSSCKDQPWKAHYTPQPGNPAVVSYQEAKGSLIIADGGSAGPPVEEGVQAKTTMPRENSLCPHLKPISNPTLKNQ